MKPTPSESLFGALPEGDSGSASNHAHPPPAAFGRKRLLELAVVFAGYFVGGKIGLAVPFTTGNVSPVWPPAGIALAALLLVGYRVWPAIAAGAFLVNALTPISPWAAAALAVGNTAGPMAGAWLVRRTSFRPSLNRLDDVFGLILLAAPASAALSATVGVSVLFLTRVDPWVRFGPAWLVWWFGDALGVLLVTPLALALLKRSRTIQRRRLAELVALGAAAVIASAAIFDSRVGAGFQKDALVFAIFPLVIWGAARFEIPGAAGVTLVIASIAVWETGAGHGLFLRNSTLQNAAMLQAFLAVISGSGLVLAVVIVERAEWIREQATREGREQAERRYREIVETANDGIWMLDAQLSTVFVNARMADILGYTAEEMIGKPLSEFVSKAAWEGERARVQRRGPAVREHTQAQYQRKDGGEVWASVSRTLAFAEDGALTGILAMVSDITDQKRAEGERQQALDRVVLLSEAVEQTADTVLIADSAGRILYVNPAFEATTGYRPDEAFGRTPRLLKSGQHGPAFYQDMWGRLLDGEPYRGTLVNRKKSGETYWANQTITPIKDAAGRITHFVSVLRDVTEARKYHEQEVQLRLARAVQERFYPTAPDLPGFDIGAASHPARETGGDYFDFIDAPEGILYLAVGDVSGHGFDTALIMALTRAYVRSFARFGMDVGEVLRLVNAVLVGDLEDNRYVTMLLVRLDARARTITYASAGHIPGVLLDDSEGTEDLLDSTGVPLGVFAGSTFATRQVQLRAGHVLVLGTDGATEASNPEGAEFGLHGVTEYVRSHSADTAGEIAAGIYRAVRSFGGLQPQGDDVTSVVVKVTGSTAAA
jgi:PAS domain S-box-containing protein